MCRCLFGSVCVCCVVVVVCVCACVCVYMRRSFGKGMHAYVDAYVDLLIDWCMSMCACVIQSAGVSVHVFCARGSLRISKHSMSVLLVYDMCMCARCMLR